MGDRLFSYFATAAGVLLLGIVMIVVLRGCQV